MKTTSTAIPEPVAPAVLQTLLKPDLEEPIGDIPMVAPVHVRGGEDEPTADVPMNPMVS
jgi:hypothetical protein